MNPGENIFKAERAGSEPAGDSPTVSWWITRVDNSKLSIDTNNDSISIDIGTLKGKNGQPPVISVYGEVRQNSGTNNEGWVAYQWEWVPDSNVFVPPSDPSSAVDHITIRLQDLQTTTSVDAKLKVTLKVQSKEQQIELPLNLPADPPKIAKFRATPSIVVVGANTKLEWKCENADAASVRLVGPQRKETSETTPRMNTSGLLPYELVAKNSAGVETKAALQIKVLDNSAWVAAPKWWDGQVVGLCVSPDGETLYAVVRSKSKPFGAAVWSSADGFSRWEQVATVPADQNVVHSAPVVCLQLESGPVLMFVGGSKMDYEEVSNKVCSFDLKTKEWKSQDPNKTGGGDASKWPGARMGHACVVARDADDTDKVWVIGGMNQDGNVLNDAWVSPDGKDWVQRNAPSNWQGRCLFAATAKKTDGKSEIWLGGGFDGPDGKPLSDLKVWNWKAANLAEKEIPLTLSHKDWILSGLALAALGQQVYVTGVERRLQQNQQNFDYQYKFDPVGTDASGAYYTLSTTKVNVWGALKQPASKIDAVGFNGCLWLCSLRTGPKHHEIDTNGLYYWVPPPV